MNEGAKLKNVTIHFLLVLGLFLSQADAFAKSSEKKSDATMGTELPFLKGTLVEFQSYDPDSRTYKAIAAGFPAEGDSYVTAEGIAKGIHSVTLSRLARNPTSIVGTQLTTDEELPTLTDAELKERLKKYKKAPKKK